MCYAPLSLRRVAQDLVSLSQLLKLLCSIGIVRIFIRVHLGLRVHKKIIEVKVHKLDIGVWNGHIQ